MDAILKKQIMMQKKALDMLGINYMNSDDIKNAYFMVQQLKGIEKTGCQFIKKSLSSVTLESLIGIGIFGEDILRRLNDIIANAACYACYDSELMYACHITFSVDEGKVLEDTGTVDHYKIPRKYNQVSPIFLGHEHIHALKETNYQEYKDTQRIGDVIPLFYELLQAKGDTKTVYDNWVNSRFELLLDSKDTFVETRLRMKESFRDKDLYKLIATRSGQYLNSLYYAIVLYNIYLDDQELVLNLVKKVLNHEMTTMDLLTTLGLYGKDNDNIVINEMNELKKSL